MSNIDRCLRHTSFGKKKNNDEEAGKNSRGKTDFPLMAQKSPKAKMKTLLSSVLDFYMDVSSGKDTGQETVAFSNNITHKAAKP